MILKNKTASKLFFLFLFFFVFVFYFFTARIIHAHELQCNIVLCNRTGWDNNFKRKGGLQAVK